MKPSSSTPPVVVTFFSLQHWLFLCYKSNGKLGTTALKEVPFLYQSHPTRMASPYYLPQRFQYQRTKSGQVCCSHYPAKACSFDAAILINLPQQQELKQNKPIIPLWPKLFILPSLNGFLRDFSGGGGKVRIQWTLSLQGLRNSHYKGSFFHPHLLHLIKDGVGTLDLPLT